MIVVGAALLAPRVVVHDGIAVVRDDLVVGGTKARYLDEIFDGVDAVIYASPCEGGAQVALALTAQRLGKRAVVVCAMRRTRHRRTREALALGAELVEVSGIARLRVVQARAKAIAAEHVSCRLAPFGLETRHAVQAIAAAARATNLTPDEVWCVAASGVLARGLALAWPDADRHAVQVGRRLSPADVAWASIHESDVPLRRPLAGDLFPSDPHYDAKAWRLCRRYADRRRSVVFWNVMGE